MIELQEAHVERDGITIVSGVSIAVQARGWFGVIGANGSGKTTLLRAIGGRLPFSGGSCLIDGQDQAQDRAFRARRIGFAPPSDKLPSSLRGRDILEIAGGRLDNIWDPLGDLRAALGIDALLDVWIADCSAGMRQRIAIATAFASGCNCVILDEPFNWLDPVAVFDLKRCLRRRVEEGLTLITALHDLHTLVSSCDAGMMMAAGQLSMAMPPTTLTEARRDPAIFEEAMIDRLRGTA